ncbi:hypothetical protein N9W79_01605 [bacterium]|nr:hypothetical protein [bacterium]
MKKLLMWVTSLSFSLAFLGCGRTISDQIEEEVSRDDCVSSLKKTIDTRWGWQLSSLPKEKGDYLNSLHLRSYRNDKLVYDDQKKIHSMFGVWVKKGHVSKALYSIYPYFIKKSPNDFQSLKQIEAWGSLYRYCDKNLEIAAKDSSSNEFQFSSILSSKKETSLALGSALDEILPWHSFSEQKLVDGIYKNSATYLASMTTSSKSRVNNFKRTSFGYHLPGFYSHVQLSLLAKQNYEAAVEFSSSVNSYSLNTGTANRAETRVADQLAENLYCESLEDGYSEDDAKLMTALASHIFKLENGFCKAGYKGHEFCSDTLLSNLSQITKDTRNFDFDQKIIVPRPEKVLAFLEQFKNKNFNRKNLAKSLLGANAKSYKAAACL